MVPAPRNATVTTVKETLFTWSPERTVAVILNNGSDKIYIGVDASLNATNGFPIDIGQVIVLCREFGDDPTLERIAVAATGSQDVRLMEEYGPSLTTALFKLIEAMGK